MRAPLRSLPVQALVLPCPHDDFDRPRLLAVVRDGIPALRQMSPSKSLIFAGQRINATISGAHLCSRASHETRPGKTTTRRGPAAIETLTCQRVSLGRHGKSQCHHHIQLLQHYITDSSVTWQFNLRLSESDALSAQLAQCRTWGGRGGGGGGGGEMFLMFFVLRLDNVQPRTGAEMFQVVS